MHFRAEHQQGIISERLISLRGGLLRYILCREESSETPLASSKVWINRSIEGKVPPE
jgi:hypothetical protein